MHLLVIVPNVTSEETLIIHQLIVILAIMEIISLQAIQIMQIMDFQLIVHLVIPLIRDGDRPLLITIISIH